jgi:cytochrome c biogenesis protein CcmG/thiol:disulfide interchange protein DsbE
LTDYNQGVLKRIRLAALVSSTCLLIAAAITVAGCQRTPGTASNGPKAEPSATADLKPDAERKSAPDFELKDATGAPVKLSSLKGKVVLLNFWATWCGPCEAEIPWFIEFQQKYKDRDFTVVGVSMDDDGWKSVKPYMEKHKMNYPLVIGNEQVSTLYGGIDSLPTTFVVDRTGKVATSHSGLVDKADYESEILKLMDAPKPAASVPANQAHQMVADAR